MATDSEGLLEETQSFRNGRRDVNKYMSRLQKCRDLIDQSKQILAELQRSPPQRRRMHEMRAAEEKLNEYEAEIEQQIELFETSSARNEKLNAGVESLNRRLAELARALAADQEQSSIATTTTTTTLTKSQQRFESLEALEERIDDVREELAQIETMRAEIGRVGAEKSCLLDGGGGGGDVKNVSHQPLLDGFNETVLDMEMRKDKELTSRLTRMSSELDSMREKCEEKLKKLLDKR